MVEGGELGLSSPRDVCHSGIWTLVWFNAMAFLAGFNLQGYATKVWKKNVPQPIFAGILE